MKKYQYLRLLAVIAAFCLVVASCGSDDSDDSSDDASEAPAPEEEPEESAPAEEAEPEAPETTDAAAEEEDAPAEAPADDPVRVALVTSGLIGESNYFIGGVIGMEAAAEQFGIEAEIVESEADPATVAETLRGVVLDDWDMVIVMSFTFNDILAEVAPENPDIQFVCIDCFVDEPNVQNVDFRTQEASYLTGVIAAHLTETEVVGSVLAFDIPFLHRWVDPFHNAILATNPNVTILDPLEVGDFADPVTAKELALTVSGQGADIVNGLAAAGNGGVFEAAAEEGFFSFGVDINECGKAPGQIIENVIKRVDTAVVFAVGEYVAGNQLENFISLGLADKGVGISQFIEDGDTGCVFADHPELFDEVMAAQEAIIAGDIVIPDPALEG